MGKLSRTKGKVGEREVASLFTSNGMKARRGQQYRGGDGSPDVVIEDFPELHLEVKRTECLSLYKALEQAKEDSNSEQIPIVAHRKSKKEWVGILPLEDLISLIKRAYPERFIS